MKWEQGKMDHVFIFGYVAFAGVTLLLFGLIGFSWVALRKIRQCLFR
jgi:hypothetical protein